MAVIISCRLFTSSPAREKNALRLCLFF